MYRVKLTHSAAQMFNNLNPVIKKQIKSRLFQGDIDTRKIGPFRDHF